MNPEGAHLSIIDWPAGWGPERRLESLVGAAGIDPHTAELACARATPVVIATIDALIAPDVVASLRADGVTAFAPTTADLDAAPTPDRVKGFHLFPDGSALGAEFWRGEPTVIQSGDIRLVVRGDSESSSVTVRTKPGTALTFQGAVVEAATEGGVTRETTRSVAMLLDLYSVPAAGAARRLRVDADKMSFEVLGAERGYTDRENMLKLTELFRTMARSGSIDEGFARFAVPAGVVRTRGSAGRTAAFDFYSAWLFQLYRTLGAV